MGNSVFFAEPIGVHSPAKATFGGPVAWEPPAPSASGDGIRCIPHFPRHHPQKLPPLVGALRGIATPSAGTRNDRHLHWTLTFLPRALPVGLRTRPAGIKLPQHGCDHRGDGSELGVVRMTGKHSEFRRIGFGGGVATHSGMFPCFFGGRFSRLVRRARNALVTATRVAAGSITPSSSPRSAARNGLAML